MINRQLSAVVRRPMHTNMSEVVRARSPMVYEKAAMAREKEASDKDYALAKRAQSQRELVDRQNYAFQKEQAGDAKKRNRLGQVISLGTGVANIYYGNQEANAMEERAKDLAGGSAKKISETIPGSTPSTGSAVSVGSAAEAASKGAEVASGATGLWPTLKDGFVGGFDNIMKGGSIGLMASQFGSSAGSKAAIGAGVGALSNWALNGGISKLMSGGGIGGKDLVGAASSGLIGALGGFF